MKTTIDGFLFHKTNYDKTVQYSFYEYDLTSISPDASRVLIGPCTIAVDVPDDFDPTPGRIALLREQKAKISAELTMKVTQLDAQINELLSIEHKAAV